MSVQRTIIWWIGPNSDLYERKFLVHRTSKPKAAGSKNSRAK